MNCLATNDDSYKHNAQRIAERTRNEWIKEERLHFRRKAKIFCKIGYYCGGDYRDYLRYIGERLATTMY